MREEYEDTPVEDVEYTQLSVNRDGEISYEVIYDDEDDGFFPVLHFHALAGSSLDNIFNDSAGRVTAVYFILLRSIYLGFLSISSSIRKTC